MNSLTEKQRENCARLADILKDVPKRAFHMGTWAHATEDERNHCGTVGCAMGWAAMSGRIPRLQYAAFNIHDTGRYYFTALADVAKADYLEPVLDGKSSSWASAGYELFGGDTYDYVFIGKYRRKGDVIRALRRLAKGEQL